MLVNPLHAAEPLPPVSPSPYLPMSRRFISPLYLRIEDIPEYGRLPAADRGRIERLAAPLRARNTSSELIDQGRGLGCQAVRPGDHQAGAADRPAAGLLPAVLPP